MPPTMGDSLANSVIFPAPDENTELTRPSLRGKPVILSPFPRREFTVRVRRTLRPQTGVPTFLG